MPRPKGWTADDEALRDRCVRELEPDESSGRIRSAYAVCTASVAKHKRDGNPADVIAYAKKLWKELFP